MHSREMLNFRDAGHTDAEVAERFHSRLEYVQSEMAQEKRRSNVEAAAKKWPAAGVVVGTPQESGTYETRNAAIAALYDYGISREQLAEHFQMKRDTLSTALRHAHRGVHQPSLPYTHPGNGHAYNTKAHQPAPRAETPRAPLAGDSADRLRYADDQPTDTPPWSDLWGVWVKDGAATTFALAVLDAAHNNSVQAMAGCVAHAVRQASEITHTHPDKGRRALYDFTHHVAMALMDGNGALP